MEKKVVKNIVAICDIRCWMAEGEECSCGCGGKNHGCINRDEKPDLPPKEQFLNKIDNEIKELDKQMKGLEWKSPAFVKLYDKKWWLNKRKDKINQTYENGKSISQAS